MCGSVVVVWFGVCWCMLCSVVCGGVVALWCVVVCVSIVVCGVCCVLCSVVCGGMWYVMCVVWC